MNGSLSEWLYDAFGIEEADLHPSLRFGFDSALLMSFAAMQGIPLHNIYTQGPGASENVSVNALLPSISDRDDALESCRQLLSDGYHTIKIKVARSQDPAAEAKVINSIFHQFGDRLKIRLDANRAWSLEEALIFAKSLSCSNLEYLEEPVANPSDLEAFCQEANIPIALDESFAACHDTAEMAELLKKSKGVTSCVLKPSCIGSIDRLVEMIELCTWHSCKAVISSTFESHVGLSMLSSLAAIADNRMQQRNGIQTSSVSHGLGTLEWFSYEEKNFPAGISCLASPSIPLSHSWQLLTSYACTLEVPDPPEAVTSAQTVTTAAGDYQFSYDEIGGDSEGKKPLLLFLHGFLGSAQDWLPIMHYLSDAYHCIAIDLPGHGGTTLASRNVSCSTEMYDFIHVSEALQRFCHALGKLPHCIVGYSLGGRLAQHMTIHMGCPKLIVVSGSLGIEDPLQRALRRREDHEAAAALSGPLPFSLFLRRWYEGRSFWTELRKHHTMYTHLLQRRCQGARPALLAKALVGLSPGKMEPLEHRLLASKAEILFAYGEEDATFRRLMQSLHRRSGNRLVFVPFTGGGHGLLAEKGLRLGAIVFGHL